MRPGVRQVKLLRSARFAGKSDQVQIQRARLIVNLFGPATKFALKTQKSLQQRFRSFARKGLETNNRVYKGGRIWWTVNWRGLPQGRFEYWCAGEFLEVSHGLKHLGR